jgi:hypothetical protein
LNCAKTEELCKKMPSSDFKKKKPKKKQKGTRDWQSKQARKKQTKNLS